MEKHKTNKLIICGGYEEFNTYCQENFLTHPAPDLFYIHSAYQLLGLENFELIYYGRWWLNPVIKSGPYKLLLQRKYLKEQE